MNMSSFSSALNEAQLEAVTYCDGPSLVVAGAGSGKTRVLTYKTAYLLQEGLQPYHILALTFTNKASREMNERIAQICASTDVSTRGLWSGTFHSIFARLLRMEHEFLPYPPDYTIYDAADAKSLIKTIVKEMGLDDKKYKPSAIACRISEAKNHLLLPAQYSADSSIAKRDSHDGLEKTADIYTAYQRRLTAAGAMDFDDLLLNTYLLLKEHAEVRERYKDKFRYILVDEYQDTNIAQHRILRLLTEPDSRICVVGDDAQSIYGFRGADISNILNFTEQYPTAKIIKLECNYRSTQNIVEAANSIINNNAGQIPKKVYSAGEKGDKICIFEAQTDKEEAKKVVGKIRTLHGRKGLEFDDIALLYRTNAQSRVFEEAFQAANIPYRIYGGQQFYQRKEIKDVLAYFRLIVNPDDEEAFKRVVNYPTRGIGNTTLLKLRTAAAQTGTSLWKAATAPEACGLTLSNATRNRLADFCRLIMELQEESATLTASDVARNVITRSGIAADLSSVKTMENIARQENVNELLGSIQTYEKEALEERGQETVPLTEFLSMVSLLTDTDEADDDLPHVTLMTVHAAKGLEYAAVFVTGMEEDLFPNANARFFPKEMEEERRLFYVAVTRAKTYCFLSFARTRFRYGTMDICEPSLFLSEIDERYVTRELRQPDFHDASPWKKYAGQRKRPTDLWDNADNYRDYSAPSSSSRPSASFPSCSQEKPYGRRSSSDYPRDRSPRYSPPPPIRQTPPQGFRRISRPSASGQPHLQTAASGLPAVGTRIHHERFGTGTVAGTEGSGDSARMRVEFDKAGVKNLLVKFAKFTLL